MVTKRAEQPAPAHVPPGGAASSPLDWPFDTGVVDRVLGRLAEKVQKKRRRNLRTAAGASTAALALLVAFWLVPLVRDTSTIHTAAARPQVVVLPDGSRAELNAQTHLRTDFRYGRRHLRLERGEALFSVAKDADHPFLVETPHGTVRVLGTIFDVRLAGDTHPDVTLLRGSIVFEALDGTTIRLSPGQQLSGASHRVRNLSLAELENLTTWRQGRLVLDGLTLAEAASRLAQFHGTSIVVAPEIANLRPGGTVPLGSLKKILEALQEALPVRVEQAGDSIHIVAR
ncbi:MAG: FecR domain-containing protein [Verrucomicrobiota bacterium]